MWNATLWAVGALVVYVAASLALGEVFPFSRYSMYAKLRGRVEGAVLGVRVAGALVPIGRLERFVGLDPEKVRAEGYPCSQTWVVVETSRWIAEHPGADVEASAVEVEVGFRVLRLEQFVLHERWASLTSGHAHWRRG